MCAHYAPTMRPLCPETVPELNRWDQSAPPMRPLCAYHAPTVSINRLDLHQWAQSAPPMRPLCAHNAPTNSTSRFEVVPLGPKCARYAPTMCSLFASILFAFEAMGPHCAPCAPTMLCFETASGEIRCIDPRQRAHYDEKLANTFVDRARCGHFSDFWVRFLGGTLGRRSGRIVGA